MKVNKETAQMIIRTANAMRKSGWKVSINEGIPYVVIENDRTGEEYYFQGDEALDLLDEVPDNVNTSDYLLYISTGF